MNEWMEVHSAVHIVHFDDRVREDKMVLWLNKVIALRGSTPKRDTQQQCVCTINTAKPCHAMSHHDIKCNTIQVQPVQCNPVPFHATPYRAIPCNAMPPHAIQRHSLLIQYHTMQRHVTSCHAMEIRAI